MSGVKKPIFDSFEWLESVKSFFPLLNDNNVIDLLLHPHDEFDNKKVLRNQYSTRLNDLKVLKVSSLY